MFQKNIEKEMLVCHIKWMFRRLIRVSNTRNQVPDTNAHEKLSHLSEGRFFLDVSCSYFKFQCKQQRLINMYNYN